MARTALSGRLGRRALAGLVGALAAGSALAGSAAAQDAPTAPTTSDTVLVKVDPSASTTEQARLEQALHAEDSEDLGGGWHAYQLDDPTTLAEARTDLKKTDSDVAVVLDAPLFPAGMPNDPLFGPVGGGYQWALENTAAWGGGVADADIQAPEAWDASAGGADVVVAVTDTGMDVNHPDLAGRIWTNPGEIPGNGIDDDGNGRVDDVTGWDFSHNDGSVFDVGDDESHGTHVAGIIAATRDNGVGIAGVAANARIMPLKFISGGVGYTSDAIIAINYAADHGATVINASWGGGSHSQPLCDAISLAAARGVTFVGAAGNSSLNTDVSPTAPASCTEATAITVAATNHADQLSGFSNFGVGTVDLGAPGENIVATIPGGYGYKSGTSMASPYVAGVAAVVRGMRPAATPAQVKDAIVGGAVPIPALAGRTASGARLNLAGSVARVTGIPVAPPPAANRAPADGTPAPSRRRKASRFAIRARAANGDIALRVTSGSVGTTTVKLSRGHRALGTFRLRAKAGTTAAIVPAGIARRAARGGTVQVRATMDEVIARTAVRVRPFSRARSSRLAAARGTLTVRLSRRSRLHVNVMRGTRKVAAFRARGKAGFNAFRLPRRVATVMSRSGAYTVVVTASSARTAVGRARILSR